MIGEVPGIPVQDLRVDGARAFLSLDGMLDVYDVSDPTNPQRLRSTGVQHRSVASKMAIAKGHVFGGSGSHNYARGVAIAPITLRTCLVSVASISLGSTPSAACPGITAPAELSVLDSVPKPKKPTRAGSTS